MVVIQKIGELTAKTIIQRSGLSASSCSINPYCGCSHACAYCYACFTRKFTTHTEPWGEYVDAKINAPHLFEQDLIRLRKKNALPTPKSGVIFFGSATDVYQRPAEEYHQLTRGILEALIRDRLTQQKSAEGFLPGLAPEPSSPPIMILTKSDLVLRDMDLLTQIPNIEVGFSIALADERAREIIEPGASPLAARYAALRQLHEAGITTFAFVNPALPYLTPFREIVPPLRGIVSRVFSESLNTGHGILPGLYRAVAQYDATLLPRFRKAIFSREFIAEQKSEFFQTAAENGIVCEGFWDHPTQEEDF